MCSQPSAAVGGAAASGEGAALGVGGAAPGKLCVFVRQTTAKGDETIAAEKRVPLGVYLLDGDRVVTPASFCKAGEVSVAFDLDEALAASPHLSIAPCTFVATHGFAGSLVHRIKS